jgi:UDP:flavonoid glycosyltransferase YjiC (YdhE family)
LVAVYLPIGEAWGRKEKFYHCFSDQNGGQVNDFPFNRLPKDKPKIYVSLGTVFNKKPKIFNKLIKAFADGGYQFIISAGNAFAKL